MIVSTLLGISLDQEDRHPAGYHALACYMVERAVSDLKALRERGAINGLAVNRDWFKDGSEYGDYENPEDVDDLLEFFTTGAFANWFSKLDVHEGLQASDCLSRLGFDPEKCGAGDIDDEGRNAH